LLYFRAIADQAKIPLIVEGAEPEAAARMAQHPNIIAFIGNGGAHALSSDACNLWTALQTGASGAILDFAAAAPYACIAIWEAHRTREEEAGLDWQRRIARTAELVSPRCHGVPALKHAMDLHGYYGGPPRLPLAVPPAEVRRAIEEAFRDLPTDR
jgi:4-hydroxy-2-oxoglutarate aldolase